MTSAQERTKVIDGGCPLPERVTSREWGQILEAAQEFSFQLLQHVLEVIHV